MVPIVRRQQFAAGSWSLLDSYCELTQPCIVGAHAGS
jgi:hypothetical protein